MTPVQETICGDIAAALVGLESIRARAIDEFTGLNVTIETKNATIASLEAGVNPAMQVQIDDLHAQVEERQSLVTQLLADKAELASRADALSTELADASNARDAALAELARLNNGIDVLQGQAQA